VQGAVKGLRSLIQNENKSALHVWCSAHCLNFCEATECAQDFFGTINSLVTFLGARKRTAFYTPLSNYLQNSAIDFIQAIYLIKVTRQQIQDLRAMKTESVYENLFSETKLFCEAHDLEEHDLAEDLARKK